MNVDSQFVVNPNPSGVHVSLIVENPDSKQITLARKYRESLKLSEKPLKINSLFNTKILALLTEEVILLKPLVRALEAKKYLHATKVGAYFHQYYKIFHTSKLFLRSFGLRTSLMNNEKN